MSGTLLKLIALLTMLVDHIGAIFFPDQIIFRMIGRLSMPIFCFFIIEGIKKTSNPKRYLFRLGLFALVSELPFDLALFNQFFHWQTQNVFFTFFLGAAALYIYDNPEQISGLIRFGQKKETSAYQYAPEVVKLFILPAAAGVSIALKTDYDFMGFFMLLLLYFTYNMNTRLRMGLYAGLMSTYGIYTIIIEFAVQASNWREFLPWAILWFVAALAVIPLAFYNGKRGKGIKWLFYVFYPAHLLILYLLSVFVIKQ